ncbi:MAG: hypothetical protein LJE91_10475 [Gammaproteobacteria bacterium]|nr:hypothetical protein [Gammaproteobacteria bacterium]
MRRMIRDSWRRNLQPLETLTHWHHFRSSELRNIIPFIKSVGYVVNSALPFELPILKHHLYDYFPTAISTYKNEPKRQDAYIRAKRVKEFLDGMIAIADDSAIGGESLVREFIGGSDYAY